MPLTVAMLLWALALAAIGCCGAIRTWLRQPVQAGYSSGGGLPETGGG